MANNIDLPINGVTKTIATRDNAGVHTQVFGLDATEQAQIGSVSETSPATDTASSGLNGRLQRIAQHLTSLIALFPLALTAGGNFKAAILEALPAGTNLLGNIGIDQTTPGTTDSVTVKAADGIGSLIEAAPATDTASSGLNGRLQRIAQHLTSLLTVFSPLTTPVITRVAASATNTNLLAVNSSRRDAILYNDSTAKVRVKYGSVAASTDFTFILDAGQAVALSNFGVVYTGAIDAIWESAAGAMQVTELS
jgi:hypothetical protein